MEKDNRWDIQSAVGEDSIHRRRARLECILKENYREERERNEWRDTNVTKLYSEVTQRRTARAFESKGE